MTRYLSRADVRKQLGVPADRHWSDCNRAVALAFELSGDWMASYQTKIPEQLAAGIRVLVYAGDQDYIWYRDPPLPLHAAAPRLVHRVPVRALGTPTRTTLSTPPPLPVLARSNWLGNRAWAHAMKWAHQDDFGAAAVSPWLVEGKQAGTRQSAANFTFLRVYEAGHMVPCDKMR